MMRATLSSIGFICLLILAGAQSFTYQGFLRVSGSPANGAYDFRFRLWNAATGGAQVASEQFVNDLNVQNGLFTTELNFGNVWDGSERYLEIGVRHGASTGGYQELRPRVKITRTPYAARADAAPPVGAAGGDLSGSYPNPTVARLQGRSVSSAAPSTGQVLKWNGSAWAPGTDLRDAFWQASGSNIFYNAGNVGIGSSPAFRLTVQSDSGVAIYGVNTASGTNHGVLGSTRSAESSAYGVYGIEPSGGAGHAVYAYGTLAAAGTKSFQIDHPLRPETHYLNHFCIEAPEPYNAYSGNVVTDAQGYATVQLPDYFERVNRDFRYQLTVIDDSDDFVQAKVARKIQNNQFVIRTSKPFVEVSWRVEAIRNDLWVQRYGYQTEQEKEDEIKGKYLNPELYGQPKERGIHYRPELERLGEIEKPQ